MSSRNLLKRGSTKGHLAGPSGTLSIRGKLTSSSRFCGVELEPDGSGARTFVVRKGGPAGAVERRVPLSAVEEVREVGVQEKEFMLVGTTDKGRFEISFKVNQSEGGRPARLPCPSCPPWLRT